MSFIEGDLQCVSARDRLVGLVVRLPRTADLGSIPVILLGQPLVGLVVKASASRAEDPGFKSHLCGDSSHTSDLKIGIPVLPCQASGVMGSVLGLVGPVTFYVIITYNYHYHVLFCLK